MNDLPPPPVPRAPYTPPRLEPADTYIVVTGISLPLGDLLEEATDAE